MIAEPRDPSRYNYPAEVDDEYCADFPPDVQQWMAQIVVAIRFCIGGRDE